MATRTFGTSYLMGLTNANHDGVTQQIDDRLQVFESDNQMLVAAATAVHHARLAEDAAYPDAYLEVTRGRQIVPRCYLSITRDRRSEKYDSCNHYRQASTRSEAAL